MSKLSPQRVKALLDEADAEEAAAAAIEPPVQGDQQWRAVRKPATEVKVNKPKAKPAAKQKPKTDTPKRKSTFFTS